MKNDLCGKRIGKLTVLSPIYSKRGKFGKWLCKCDCGKNTEILTSSFLSGHKKSCGCLVSGGTHGLSNTNSYKIWCSMKRRCLGKSNKNKNNYKDRGITVCDRWMKFENFYIDMGERPEGMSIDRIDNNDNYCKENCRWATDHEQANNKRSNRPLEYNGEILNSASWAHRLGIDKGVIQKRIDVLGWSVEKALTTPIRGNLFRNITFDNKTMSLKEWSIFTGISIFTLKNRIKRYGWSIKKTLTTPACNHIFT